jgi:uncharacterized protein (DUF39 family)
MSKTLSEINKKISGGKAIVLTAEEMIELVEKEGAKKAAQEVDVVTTGTFGPMCSSGAYINIGQPKPKIKLGGGICCLNDVPAYCGFAAADIYIGATQVPDHDPLNKVYPGKFNYGGAHVIEELTGGKDIRLTASSYGTDCYPRKKLETLINIKDLNEAVLFNPRNAYQNYNVAVNLSDKTIYTYMGTLKPNLGNAHYCSAGQLSPLLNDPLYKTIGIGTKIFLGGGIGYIAWQGTQHSPAVNRKDNDVPNVPAGTLAVIGDLKGMESKWLVGTSMLGYGVSLTVGIGVPIPILDENIAQFTAIKDEDIFAPIVDYSTAYPQRKSGTLGEVSYAELRSGTITIQRKEIITASLSSYYKAREIAETLKNWIIEKKFLLTESVAILPGPETNMRVKSLKERAFQNDKRRG